MNNSAPPCPDHAVSAAEAEAFARALHGILARLCLLVVARIAILGPFALRFHGRLTGASRRIVALLSRLAAGRAAARPRPGRPSGTAAVRLPRGEAWLVHLLGHHAAGLGSHLDHVLNDPRFTPLLAAAPGIRRHLSPILRALGLPCRMPPGPAPRRPRPFRPPAGTRPRSPGPAYDPPPLAINLPPMAPFGLPPPRRPAKPPACAATRHSPPGSADRARAPGRTA